MSSKLKQLPCSVLSRQSLSLRYFFLTWFLYNNKKIFTLLEVKLLIELLCICCGWLKLSTVHKCAYTHTQTHSFAGLPCRVQWILGGAKGQKCGDIWDLCWASELGGQDYDRVEPSLQGKGSYLKIIILSSTLSLSFSLFLSFSLSLSLSLSLSPFLSLSLSLSLPTPAAVFWSHPCSS